MENKNFLDVDNLPEGGVNFYLLPDGKTFVVMKSFVIFTSIGKVEIPKGFVTDLASIPPKLRSIISVLGKHFIAAVLHDLWYRVPEQRRPGSAYISRELADEIFLKEMEDLDVSWWKRRLMYRAVRIGGADFWRGEDQNDKLS